MVGDQANKIEKINTCTESTGIESDSKKQTW